MNAIFNMKKYVEYSTVIVLPRGFYSDPPKIVQAT